MKNERKHIKQNKEENPMAPEETFPHQRQISLREIRILLRKTRRKILSSPKGSDFAPQNKEDLLWQILKRAY